MTQMWELHVPKVIVLSYDPLYFCVICSDLSIFIPNFIDLIFLPLFLDESG